MPEINVPLAQWIISQAIMVLAIIACMIAFNIKRKTTTLLLVGVSVTLQTISVALLLNWVLFALIMVAAVRVFVFAFFEYRKEHSKEIKQWVTIAFMIIFMVSSVIPVLFLWSWWLDWLLLAAALVLIVGYWAKGIHLMRISSCIYESLTIVNHAVYFNVFGIVLSSLMLISIAVFYGRYFYQKRRVQARSQ